MVCEQSEFRTSFQKNPRNFLSLELRTLWWEDWSAWDQEAAQVWKWTAAIKMHILTLSIPVCLTWHCSTGMRKWSQAPSWWRRIPICLWHQPVIPKMHVWRPELYNILVMIYDLNLSRQIFPCTWKVNKPKTFSWSQLLWNQFTSQKLKGVFQFAFNRKRNCKKLATKAPTIIRNIVPVPRTAAMNKVAWYVMYSKDMFSLTFTVDLHDRKRSRMFAMVDGIHLRLWL